MDKNLFEEAFFLIQREGGYACNKLALFDVTGSTNDEIKILADKGSAEGTVAIAMQQTRGQGRSGRSFFSPAGGNLYMSMLLRPTSMAPLELLTPAAAVATARAIKKVCDKDVQIKWVNDLFYNDKKVCGIIAKAYNIGKPDMYVILGVGINVHKTDDEIPSDIKSYGVLYDSQQSSSDVEIIPKLCANIYSEYMGIYSDLDDIDFMDEYRFRSNVIDRDVRYIDGDSEKTIHVVDIDNSGRLVALGDDGEFIKYRDGEIRISIETN